MNNKIKSIIGSLFIIILFSALTIIPIIDLWDEYGWVIIPIWIGIEIVGGLFGYMIIKSAEWMFLK